MAPSAPDGNEMRPKLSEACASLELPVVKRKKMSFAC
jgi:hypothetical protein